MPRQEAAGPDAFSDSTGTRRVWPRVLLMHPASPSTMYALDWALNSNSLRVTPIFGSATFRGWSPSPRFPLGSSRTRDVPVVRWRTPGAGFCRPALPPKLAAILRIEFSLRPGRLARPVAFQARLVQNYGDDANSNHGLLCLFRGAERRCPNRRAERRRRARGHHAAQGRLASDERLRGPRPAHGDSR